MKRSRRERKFVNSMRAMADVPWPARRYRYPPTLRPLEVGVTCQRPVSLEWRRRGRVLGYIRAPEPRSKLCGARLELVPYKHRLECPACRVDGKRTRLEQRIANPPKTAEVAARWHGRRAKQAVGRFFSRRKV